MYQPLKLVRGNATIPLLNTYANLKPIILSTGMNDIKSIKKSVKIIRKYKSYALLHCTNLYPTKLIK